MAPEVLISLSMRVSLLILLFVSVFTMPVSLNAGEKKGQEPKSIDAVVADNAAPEPDEFLLPLREGTQFPVKKANQEGSEFSPWRTLGATVFVLCALIAINLYIKKGRLSRKLSAPKHGIKLVDRFAVDYKRSLILVEVDGRRSLIGVSSDKMNCITSYEVGSTDEDGSFKTILEKKVPVETDTETK